MDFELHQNRCHVSTLLTVVTPAPSKKLGKGQVPDKVFAYLLIY